MYLVLVAAGFVFTYAALTLPGIPKSVAHKSDIQAALGAPAVQAAEKAVAQAAAAQQLVVTGIKVVGEATTDKKGDTTVHVLLTISGGKKPIPLTVTLTKSVYTVTGIHRG